MYRALALILPLSALACGTAPPAGEGGPPKAGSPAPAGDGKPRQRPAPDYRTALADPPAFDAKDARMALHWIIRRHQFVLHGGGGNELARRKKEEEFRAALASLEGKRVAWALPVWSVNGAGEVALRLPPFPDPPPGEDSTGDAFTLDVRGAKDGRFLWAAPGGKAATLRRGDTVILGGTIKSATASARNRGYGFTHSYVLLLEGSSLFMPPGE